jgi:hypothetical protein
MTEIHVKLAKLSRRHGGRMSDAEYFTICRDKVAALTGCTITPEIGAEKLSKINGAIETMMNRIQLVTPTADTRLMWDRLATKRGLSRVRYDG